MHMLRSQPVFYLARTGDPLKVRTPAFGRMQEFFVAVLQRNRKQQRAAPHDEGSTWSDTFECELNSHSAICRRLRL